jgi:predicted SprT family Zn-dependent metalloprotease
VLSAVIARCTEIWEMPELNGAVHVAYNPRLRTTLGRALPAERRVELNTRLLRRHPAELVPTLIHELAHLAVHERYGAVRPHGRHFRTLMRAVNLSAQTTHSLPTGNLRRTRRRYLYVHRCDECGQHFVARRVRRELYCTLCGPEMNWGIFRIANTPEGRRKLADLRGQLAGKGGLAAILPHRSRGV